MKAKLERYLRWLREGFLQMLRLHPVESALTVYACAGCLLTYELDWDHSLPKLALAALFFAVALVVNNLAGRGPWRRVYWVSWTPIVPLSLWGGLEAWIVSEPAFLTFGILVPLALLMCRRAVHNERFVCDALLWLRSGVLAVFFANVALGLFGAILFSTTYIFGLEGAWIDHVWTYALIVFETFAVPVLFLMMADRWREAGYESNRILEILLNYIVAPALLIYTAILYLYMAKILVTWSLPEGGVAYLVFGFTLFALAEKALLPMIPSVEEFPYAIRVVSEVLSSNGSTSQASICGSTLALMDAGVPIKRPVAGISCGLISDQETGEWRTFTDIQGVEDFHGEMDFKVAGTKKGITAIQMDLKNDGLTMAIIKNALEITYDARVQILDQIMLPCISEPRAEVSQYAPKMITMHIDPERIREVIGKGGSVIQKIVADTGAKVDIDDDGTIHIASANAAACDAAKKCIDDIVFVPEVGKLYYGRVVRLMQFGAFVEIAPGKDGLVHISKLDRKRVEKVEDVVTVGDMIWVKFMEIDEKGRWNLSRKDALIEIEAQQAAAKAAEQQ